MLTRSWHSLHSYVHSRYMVKHVLCLCMYMSVRVRVAGLAKVGTIWAFMLISGGIEYKRVHFRLRPTIVRRIV